LSRQLVQANNSHDAGAPPGRHLKIH